MYVILKDEDEGKIGRRTGSMNTIIVMGHLGHEQFLFSFSFIF